MKARVYRFRLWLGQKILPDNCQVLQSFELELKLCEFPTEGVPLRRMHRLDENG